MRIGRAEVEEERAVAVGVDPGGEAIVLADADPRATPLIKTLAALATDPPNSEAGTLV